MEIQHNVQMVNVFPDMEYLEMIKYVVNVTKISKLVMLTLELPPPVMTVFMLVQVMLVLLVQVPMLLLVLEQQD